MGIEKSEQMNEKLLTIDRTSVVLYNTDVVPE